MSLLFFFFYTNYIFQLTVLHVCPFSWAYVCQKPQLLNTNQLTKNPLRLSISLSYLLFVNTQISWRQKTGSGCKHATLFQIEKFEIPICVIFWKEAERQLCEERKEIYRSTLERVCAWADSSWGSFKRAREPLVSNETTSEWITACYQPSGERLGGQQRLRTHQRG